VTFFAESRVRNGRTSRKILPRHPDHVPPVERVAWKTSALPTRREGPLSGRQHSLSPFFCTEASLSGFSPPPRSSVPRWRTTQVRSLPLSSLSFFMRGKWRKWPRFSISKAHSCCPDAGIFAQSIRQGLEEGGDSFAQRLGGVFLLF